MVPCQKELYQELCAWVSFRNLKSDDLIFTNEVGNPIEHNNFRRRHFDKDLRRVPNVTKISFHDLRHTAATLMISKGVDVPTVQKILGHAEISTTMRYVHLLKDSIEKASFMFSVMPLSGAFRELSAHSLRVVK